MLRKLGNICCANKMFLTKIRNIFCVPDTKFVSATNVARAGKRGNIRVGNNVSSFASTFRVRMLLKGAVIGTTTKAKDDLFCVNKPIKSAKNENNAVWQQNLRHYDISILCRLSYGPLTVLFPLRKLWHVKLLSVKLYLPRKSTTGSKSKIKTI